MKRRIAVLGGGIGALSTVYELTSRPGFKDRFEITVYQLGHRLGGKGASGVNRQHHDRIEEHGLHIFWGFYENAFRMMREVYAELGRAPSAPLAAFEDAFFRHDLIVVPERGKNGEQSFWPLRMPRNERTPGDGLDDLLEPWDYVPRLLGWLLETMGFGRLESPGIARAAGALDERAIAEGGSALERVLRTIGEALLSSFVHVGRAARALVPVARDLAAARALAGAPTASPRGRASSVLFLVRHAQRCFDRLIDSGETDVRLRTQVDLAMTLLRGLLADGLVIPPRDFHALDDESLRGWLARHGARRETLASPLLEGLHAAIYSSGLEIAAGTAVHGLLRIAFTYKGSILWKMRAGMGETIFAPLYEVLRRRGVRFEFFHAVDALRLSPDRGQVARIDLTVQARARAGCYRPLVEVNGLPVWPSKPDWDQLERGAELDRAGADFENWWREVPDATPRTLTLGTDFDEVVLGISLGALRDVCADLCADNPRFGAMVEHVKTTLTQSAQLWLNPALESFGHDSNDPPIVIPYAAPLDTWADMSHLIARESWPEAQRPATCAYLTARLEDSEPQPPRCFDDYPERVSARVRANTTRWLRESAGGLWPGAQDRDDPQKLNWHWLNDPLDRDNEERLDAQWFSPVSNPSDRYVLSLPGTTRYRLRSHESGYENLVLAGDWTRNAINGGCVESAVMSGLDAARQLDPAVRAGIGDWLGSLEKTRGACPTRLPVFVPAPAVHVTTGVQRGLPRYALRDGELIAVPPILLDVDVTMFALRAGGERLQSLLDTLLNLDPGGAIYRPLSPLAILYFARVDNHAVTDPLGYVPEYDFGIWVPALGGTMRGGRFEPDRLVTFSPYLWVSNDVALTNGRSIFGFFKDLGTSMSMPDDEFPDRPFALDAWVMPELGPDKPLASRRLFEVQSTPDKQLRESLGGFGRLVATVARSIADRGDRETQLSALRTALAMAKAAPRGQRMVLLKQLPDVLDARRACYQAVVETDIRFQAPPITSWRACHDRIFINEYDSHRIVSTLGLEAEEETAHRYALRPLAAARSRFRATLGNSELIWERGAASPRGRQLS